MAGTITKIVDPDDGDGTDYTSLDAWEDDLGGTTSGHLVNDNEIAVAECRNSGGSADTLAVNIGGWTTGASNYIEIKGMDGYQSCANQNYWDDNCYRLEITDTNAITNYEDYVRIHGIQIKVTNNGSDTRGLYNQINVTSDFRFYDCIVKGIQGGSAANLHCGIWLHEGTNTVWNCLVYDFPDGSTDGVGIYSRDNTNNIYNCTVHNCEYGIYSAYTPENVVNCIVFDCGDDFLDGCIVDYCASDDNDADGGHNIDETDGGGSDWDDNFTNYGVDDFTLKSGAPVIDGCNGDPSGGLYTTDIRGETRDGNWDPGCFEYISESSSSSSSSISVSVTKSSSSVSISETKSSTSSSSISVSETKSSTSSSSVSVSETKSSTSSTSSTSSFSSSSFSLIYADQNYSRETAAALRGDDAQLGTLFDQTDYGYVAVEDEDRVNQNITSDYGTFLFKDYNVAEEQFTVTWIGQSSLAPSSSTIYLQVYNQTLQEWETIDSDNAADADEDFELTSSVIADLEDYFDANGWVACRVYQQVV